MPFQQATATDYLVLLDELRDFTTSRHVATEAVNAGGTAYVVGDILTVAGGTSTHAATIKVLTVAGGVITDARMEEHGTYSVDATPLTANAVTGGTGSSATFDITVDDTGWTLKRETKQAVSAVIGAGGTGYTVGDDIEIADSDSVGRGVKAKFNVDTLSGSAVATLSLLTAGDYEETATNAVATTGGTGTGCTLTVTYAAATSQNKLIILEGEGSGTDNIFVGIKTYSSGSARNWELHGFTGFDIATTFDLQPGISPGLNPADGTYVPLASSSIDQYWFQVDGFHISMVSKISTTYPNMHMGFVNRFGTAAEYPYPLLIMGCSSDSTKLFSDTAIGFSGMLDPISHTVAAAVGPGVIRDPGGTWKNVRTSAQNGANRSAANSLVVWPAGNPDISGVIDAEKATDEDFTTNAMIPNSGNPGTETLQLYPSEGSPDESPLFPTMLIEATPVKQLLGEMREVFWISGYHTSPTLLQAEDTVDIGTDEYIIFQNCNRSNPWAFFCVKRV